MKLYSKTVNPCADGYSKDTRRSSIPIGRPTIAVLPYSLLPTAYSLFTTALFPFPRHHRLRHPEGPQHRGGHGQPAAEIRLHDQPRHHLCGHHTDGPRLGHDGLPAALRADQLPQQPVRRGRHHQRGRPQVRPVRRPQVRRHLRAHQPGQHPLLQPGDHGRLRPDDPGLRQPHPLRRHRHHGRGRGRRRAGQAAGGPHL